MDEQQAGRRAGGWRSAPRWRVAAGTTALAVLLAAAVAEPRPAGAEEACWAPAALRMTDGEARVRRGFKEANVTVTGAPLAPFTPLAKRGVVRRVDLPPGRKLVALTFDLCEQPDEIAGYQGGIVDVLRDNGVKATFFAGGKWLLTHRERALQLMADRRFELGNHTFEHRDLRILAGAPLRDEVARAQAAYEAVRAGMDQTLAPRCVVPGGGTLEGRAVPPRLSLFRFPFGACDAKSLAAVGELGLRAIQWDVSAGDPTPGQTAAQMVGAVVGGVRPGSIVLFHANGRGWHTEEALPAIIAQLRAKGYEFVTVSELLAAGSPVVAATCYDSRPGDTDHYDEFARRLEGRYQRYLARIGAPGSADTGAPPPVRSRQPAASTDRGQSKPAQGKPAQAKHVPEPTREPVGDTDNELSPAAELPDAGSDAPPEAGAAMEDRAPRLRWPWQRP
ncbi:polysaccharide deacetylase family protein [Blastochloris tepida]|uniref:Chitooligosaccharide deacetylase n=1 Tax=Blastochloris tepida TaxID=2233851 RepID=A0A348G0P2_9HYPH|nr:polysaccharide deacetylase family protein [Blastochloris tepida]BBF93125.1 hypothetical protein BLTE_18100 [Blastochloris tepida]